MTAFKIVIPSRMSSTRLPGKPLREIAGRSMIARVWDLATRAGAEEVVVATDDERIVREVETIGGVAVMTSADHTSGSDRIAEVARARGWRKDAIVVNVQGDEPCLPSALISKVADNLAVNEGAGIATMATPIASAEELFNPNAVKVVVDRWSHALYFSRAPIPWNRDAFADGQPQTLPRNSIYYRHIGMYAYRVGSLLEMSDAEPCALERSESLEQLRALYLGLGIHVGILDDPPPPGVDTEEDLLRAQDAFEGA